MDDLRTRIANVLVRDSWGLTTQTAALRQADAVIRELDGALVDFGLWLSEELRGWRMNRRDLESCLEDWKAADD